MMKIHETVTGANTGEDDTIVFWSNTFLYHLIFKICILQSMVNEKNFFKDMRLTN